LPKAKKYPIIIKINNNSLSAFFPPKKWRDKLKKKQKYMFKKAFYLFLTALLGVLLFMMLDRIAVFFYLYLVAGNYIANGAVYIQFYALDYIILTIAMMLGGWYGIWLGLYWYEKVYEQNVHRGFVHHLVMNYFPQSKPKSLTLKMSAVKDRLEDDLLQLDKLAKAKIAATDAPLPIKRKIVRRAAPKRLNTLK
jgi:hypothetical protein